MRSVATGLAAIANTLLVRLGKRAPAVAAEVRTNAERDNPTGSCSNAMAVSVLSAALAGGDVKPVPLLSRSQAQAREQRFHSRAAFWD